MGKTAKKERIRLGDSLAKEELFSIKDKIAVITGAGGGLGREVCLAFARAGAKLALVDISEDSLRAVADEARTYTAQIKQYTADLGDSASIDSLVQSLMSDWPAVDILVNCAGINKRMPILEFEEKTMDSIINVNLKGLYHISKRIAEIMKEKGGGRIINFGSLTSHMGLKNVSVYSATKSAVIGLTRVMAIEWAPYGILVNSVSPGFFETPMNKATISDEKKLNWMLDKIALNRLGQPEEITGAVLFLASPAANYITGINLFVDGGLTAGGRGW